MQLRLHSSALSFLLISFGSLLAANDTNSSMDGYISKLKQEQFMLDYKKNEAQSSKLRDSWIAPINLSYSLSRSNPRVNVQETRTAAIKMDQPIFQSGGIYYGIKFASASKKYTQFSIDVAKRKMIKDAVSFLMQIQQTALKIERQKLQISNANINLELKKEQYKSGQLDSGFLDDAIIEKNLQTQSLYDLETAKERLVSSFSALSDLDYKSATLPHLELLDAEEFLSHNIQLELIESQMKRDEYNKKMTVTKYLPSVNFTAGYTSTESINNEIIFLEGQRNFYDYGVRANLPLNINTFRDIESAKIDYLKSKVTKEDTKVQLQALFNQVVQNLKNLEKKRLLSLENRELYLKLVEESRELLSVGYKTQYDVDLLQNAADIASLDAKIFEFDRQLELLNLYEMYVNELH